MPIRVLIVDDDARFRTIARALLERSGYVIAAEAEDGAQAIAANDHVHPDAALVDVQLPDLDGLELTRRLHEINHHLRVVLTSTDSTIVLPDALAKDRVIAFVAKDKLAVTDLAPLLGG
jgi:CheY-like chemotaxis protein